MGLFSSNAADIENGRKMLQYAISSFNATPGTAYGVTAALNTGNLEKCCELFLAISSIGFPADPGPFKRLGAFATLTQAYPVFEISHNLYQEVPDLAAIWQPRIAVWTLPIFAAVLEVDGEPRCIDDLVLPTPHFQVEFIAYLRNMFQGVLTTGVIPSESRLLERATATGLILEACAYAPDQSHRPDRSLYSKAATCLDAIAADALLLNDWKFNDPEFLELATGIGVV